MYAVVPVYSTPVCTTELSQDKSVVINQSKPKDMCHQTNPRETTDEDQDDNIEEDGSEDVDDTYICGGCKNHFSDLNKFVRHKKTCSFRKSNKTPAKKNIISDGTRTSLHQTEVEQPYPSNSSNISTENSDSLSHRNSVQNATIDPSDHRNIPKAQNRSDENEKSFHVAEEKRPMSALGQFATGSGVQSLTVNNVQAVHVAQTYVPVVVHPLVSDVRVLNKSGNLAPLMLNESLEDDCPDASSEASCPQVVRKEESTVKTDQNSKMKVCTFQGCNYKARFNKDVIRHQRSHNGNRPWSCEVCSKSFSRRDKLARHMKIHTGEKKFSCEYCTYRTYEKSHYKKHLRVHTDERPYPCQVCDYRAKTTSQLTVHLRIHSGMCPYVCQAPGCSAMFKTNSDLTRHSKIHAAHRL